MLWFKKKFAEKFPAIYGVIRGIKERQKRIFRQSLLQGRVDTPPDDIPESLRSEFTFDGKIPVLKWYFDDRVAKPVQNTKKIYKQTLTALENKTFEYYDNDMLSFYDAFRDYSLEGKVILILGLAGCNCEAMALWQGADRVYVVDYNPPICEHEKITVLSHAELSQLMDAGLRFDCAFSFSSFEHDGLGRYGDPVSPNADLAVMQYVKALLKTDGWLFLGVPTGRDCLVWNAHRIYGELRLPLLLDGWLCLDSYFYRGIEIFDDQLGAHNQPLLILKNSLAIDNKIIEERIDYARTLICEGKTTTKDGKILEKVLLMQLDLLNRRAGRATS